MVARGGWYHECLAGEHWEREDEPQPVVHRFTHYTFSNWSTLTVAYDVVPVLLLVARSVPVRYTSLPSTSVSSS